MILTHQYLRTAGHLRLHGPPSTCFFIERAVAGKTTFGYCVTAFCQRHKGHTLILIFEFP